MAVEILMPKLGLTMTEGTIDLWMKDEGDSVKSGEVLCTISSEKLTHDVESPVDGVILEIIAEMGDIVPCQAPIARVGELEEKVVENSKALVKEVEDDKELASSSMAEAVEAKMSKEKEKERIFITPLARKIALEKEYDISLITGTGGNGRITRKDVEGYVPETVTQVKKSEVDQEFGVGLTGMRKIIAKKMMESLQNTAQLTLHCKADISDLMLFREKLKNNTSDKSIPSLSLNIFLIKAVGASLKEHPSMNSVYHEGEHRLIEDINIGFAVALDNGLVVPVIRQVGDKTLNKLAEVVKELVNQVRAGVMSPEIMSGSTFSITNLGSMGVEYFTPIINSPEVGILGAGTAEKVIAFDENKQIVERTKLPLSLTFDHQIIDGAPAAEFLATVCHYLENPHLLVL